MSFSKPRVAECIVQRSCDLEPRAGMEHGPAEAQHAASNGLTHSHACTRGACRECLGENHLLFELSASWRTAIW